MASIETRMLKVERDLKYLRESIIQLDITVFKHFEELRREVSEHIKELHELARIRKET